MSRCWYSGIEIRKQVPDDQPEGRVPDWRVRSIEHLINQTSQLSKHIIVPPGHRNPNTVYASQFVNTGVNSFHLPMKFRLRGLYLTEYPEFRKEAGARLTFAEFRSVFERLRNRVEKEFDYNRRTSCYRTVMNSRDIMIWEMTCAERSFPNIKFKGVDISRFVSEIC
jgi:hypothetical protein